MIHTSENLYRSAAGPESHSHKGVFRSRLFQVLFQGSVGLFWPPQGGAKVYVSSTVADLQAERGAVMEWLVQAGQQPVHTYRPDSETARESCLQDIDGCDLYVLILGHRYGCQPEEGNPKKLSITHLEFRRAGQSHIPRVALLRTTVPDIRLSDLEEPQRAPLVIAFRAEVQRKVRPAEFSDLKGLIQGLSTGVQSELNKLRAPSQQQTSQATTDSNMSRQARLVSASVEWKRKNEPDSTPRRWVVYVDNDSDAPIFVEQVKVSSPSSELPIKDWGTVRPKVTSDFELEESDFDPSGDNPEVYVRFLDSYGQRWALRKGVLKRIGGTR